MSADTTLRQRIAAVLDRLHESGAVYALDEPERNRIADALLPLFAAERAAGMRDGADWLTAEYTGPGMDATIRRAADRLHARADATGGPS